MNQEYKKEEQHLQSCLDVIRKNIDEYASRWKEMSSDVKEMYDNYRSDNPELHNELVVSMDLKSQWERTLIKNELALKKPYFGRIDYTEDEEFSLYIGKNGINKTTSDILIVDWRAPISTVYYDSDIGKSSYHSPIGEEVSIDLHLKRTYEIDEGKLVDFYDSDVIANDEFLTKYLGKNKEMILGEIIATIQKEQNEIIRDTPWHSVIVQGVAGSGKTTVAMHRISYILYNYKEKFKPQDFYIIGSNKMLLNYITGVLPNLDVYGVGQMTMDELFTSLLDKDFKKKKRIKTAPKEIEEEVLSEIRRWKGSVQFAKAMVLFLEDWERKKFVLPSIRYKNRILYKSEDMEGFLSTFPDMSISDKTEALNKRIVNKVHFQNECEGRETSYIRDECKKYRNYFGSKKEKYQLSILYQKFLSSLIDHHNLYQGKGILLPSEDVLLLHAEEFASGESDLYDLAMLNMLKRRFRGSDSYDSVSHIVVDEAQDFGASVFYVMRKLFPDCTFTIMGDVSQNINYDTGMNDWEDLRCEVFNPDKDKFYVLAKSYRNTVEISDFAWKVLKKCTFKTYQIEPIIRHGQQVVIEEAVSDQEMADVAAEKIKESLAKGYDTIAVICRNEEECEKIKNMLSYYIKVEIANEENMVFSKGVMILPVHLAKGLEFDTVILWNPNAEQYKRCDADAKLLYVAITRALHELYVVNKGLLSKLLY